MKKYLVTLVSLGLLGCSTWADKATQADEDCENPKIDYFIIVCLAKKSGDMSYCEELVDPLLISTCKVDSGVLQR